MRNLGLFREMKDLAEQQVVFVQRDEMDRFLELSSRRIRLQQEISQNGPVPPGQRMKGVSRDSQHHATEIAEEISRVIESIQETDRKIERFIREKKQGLLSDIHSMRHGRKAVKGYGARKAPKTPRFVDRKG